MRISEFLLLTFVVCAQVVKVNSVKCDADSDCKATDNTNAVCTAAKQCECKAGYAATDEGCASKRLKPTLTTTNGESFQATANAEISLTCRGTPGAEFLYFQGDDLKQTSTGPYKPTISVETKYKCVEKGSSDDLNSDESDEVTIKIISEGKDGDKPVITLPATKVKSGQTFTPTCSSVPFGATTEITASDSALAVVDGEFTQPNVLDNNLKVQCKYTIGSTSNEADANFPELFVGLSDATLFVTSEQATSPPTSAFPTNSQVSLTCNISPDEQYRGELTGLSYSWQMNGKDITDETDTVYNLDTDISGTDYSKITCEVADTTSNNIFSAEFGIEIKIDDDYIAKPVVQVDPDVPEDSAQVKCVAAVGKDLDSSLTVSWTRDGKTLEGQNDRTLQLTNLLVGKNGDFVCSTTKDGFKTDSVSVTLEVPAGKSCATHDDCDENDKSLTGTCDANRCTCADDYIPKDDACKEIEGLVCANDDDCDGNDASLSGTCNIETNTCNCADNYSLNGDKCVEQNGVSGVVASVVAVTLAVVVHQIF